MSKPSTGRFYISRRIIIGQWIWDNLKCIVCNLEIKDYEKKIYCPYCGSPSHRDHILEWIKIKSFCPYCNHKLSVKDLSGGG